MTAPDDSLAVALDDLRVAELRRLSTEATPGVWKLWGMQILADQDGTSNVDTAVPVATTHFRNAEGKPRTFDADLIALMHNTLPGLLDDLTAARARLAAVEALADEWEASYGMGGRPLPTHWGITQRITDLRAALTTQPPPQPATEPAAVGEGA